MKSLGRLISSLLCVAVVVCLGALCLERVGAIDLDDILNPPAVTEQVKSNE